MPWVLFEVYSRQIREDRGNLEKRRGDVIYIRKRWIEVELISTVLIDLVLPSICLLNGLWFDVCVARYYKRQIQVAVEV